MAKKVWNEENFKQAIKDLFEGNYILITPYKGRYEKVTLHCNVHDINFTANADCFMRGKEDIRSRCPECSAILRHQRLNSIECTCAYCGKLFYKSESKVKQSKSGLLFCCREHKDLAQRIGSGKQFNTMRPSHYTNLDDNQGGTINTYRSVAFRLYKHECAICGWNEDTDILQVHHIDENRKNNVADNLIILCPNCHAKLTSHKYILVNRNQIVLNGA